MSADARDTSGQYVASVDISRGTILITYGANANAMIAGTVLVLQPYVLPDRRVVWRCGEAAPPSGTVPMDDGLFIASPTEIEARFLPSACRP
jgi:hypothetical protein